MALDRSLTLYAEGNDTRAAGKENARVARDMSEQRKRATENIEEDEEEKAKRRKEWRKKSSDRPERKRFGRSEKFKKLLNLA